MFNILYFVLFAKVKNYLFFVLTCLKLDVFVVGHSIDLGAHVPLGHVVVAVLHPVLAVAKVTQLLPEKLRIKTFKKGILILGNVKAHKTKC